MWIFTNFGFVSAVAHRDNKDTLLVRAREPGVLEMLARRHNVKTKVVKTKNADYLYRAEFKKNVFSAIIADEVMRITYGNFKNSFRAAKQKNTYISHNALMDVWSIMHGLQRDIECGHTCRFQENGSTLDSWMDGAFSIPIQNAEKSKKIKVKKRKR